MSAPTWGAQPLSLVAGRRADIDYEALDPGIRATVIALRLAGFETTDSGDGVSKPVEARTFDGPHVVVRVDDPQQLIAEASRLAAILGLTWRIEASYVVGCVALLVATQPPADSEVPW